jgi:hypothetical protein
MVTKAFAIRPLQSIAFSPELVNQTLFAEAGCWGFEFE